MATENFIECIPQDSLKLLLLDIEIVFKHFDINALSNKHFEHEQFSSFMGSMPFRWDIYNGIIELQHVAFLWLLIEVGKILYRTLCSVTVFIWHCSGTISSHPHPHWTWQRGNYQASQRYQLYQTLTKTKNYGKLKLVKNYAQIQPNMNPAFIRFLSFSFLTIHFEIWGK